MSAGNWRPGAEIPKPRTTRQSGGAKAHAAGDSFEKWCEGQFDKALWGILAEWHHNEPRYRFDTKLQKFLPDKKGVADYSGTLEGGWSFTAEAKSRKNSFGYNELEALQIQHLNRAARSGGKSLTLLLIEFTYIPGRPQRYAVPWLEVPWVTLETAKTINPNVLTPFLIKPDPAACFLSRFQAPCTPSTPRRDVPRE